MPTRVSDLDLSANGGLGVPYNYDMAQKAKVLAERFSRGEEVTDAEVDEVRPWAELAAVLSSKQLDDPITYGYRTSGLERIAKYWHEADTIVILGGNRAGKTDILATLAMFFGLEIPEAKISFWQENDKPEVSVKIGQQKIWDKMPMVYRGVEVKALDRKKGRNYSIDFKQGSGFVGNSCILPPIWPMQENGSEIMFRSYSSFRNSPQVSEGYNSDLEIYDEEPPFDLFKKGSRPIADRKGKRIWGCTLVGGYGELAGFVLDGAETIEKKYSEWLGCDVPLVQKSKTLERCYIFYLPTEENPFVDFKTVKVGLSGLSLEEKKVRAYGVPTKRAMCRFPRYSDNINVLTRAQMDIELNGAIGADGKRKPKPITRYMCVDPAGKKPFAMIWYAVDKSGNMYVYREWPDAISFGLWAEPGGDGGNKHKGKAGPAQKVIGFGFKEYVNLIKKLEGDEIITMRYIDPRGNKTSLDDSGQITVVEKMAEHGMFFWLAQGENDIDPGLQRINDFLAYNPDEPISATNKPRLYISETCVNLIDCIKNYTGLGGYEEHYKDFIDLLRYAVSSNPVYFDGRMKISKNGYRKL